jgi:hypothetical protein
VITRHNGYVTHSVGGIEVTIVDGDPPYKRPGDTPVLKPVFGRPDKHYSMHKDQYGRMRKVCPAPARVDYKNPRIFMGREPKPDTVFPHVLKKHRHLSEREQHLVLKQVGIQWLISNGYSNVQLEVKIITKPNHVRADVYGEKDGHIAIVECGGSKDSKLRKASQVAKYIFILPYGFSIPFIWNESMNLCHTCGHQI